jgi:hypothetical protein
MKNPVRMLVPFALALGITTTWAGGVQTGTVIFQYGQYSSNSGSPGLTFFELQGSAKTGSPGCATYMAGQRWVINNSWPAAKTQVNILVVASLTGRQVTVRGSNNCGVWTDTETAVDVMLAN